MPVASFESLAEIRFDESSGNFLEILEVLERNPFIARKALNLRALGGESRRFQNRRFVRECVGNPDPSSAGAAGDAGQAQWGDP